MSEQEAWKELIKLAEAFENSSDPTIRSALREALDVKTEKFRAQLSRVPYAASKIESLASKFPDLPVDEPPAEIPVAVVSGATANLEPTSEEAVELAQSKLREAHIEKIRGNKVGAKELLYQAQQIAPNSPDVLEAIADEMVANGNRRDALELYRRAFEIAPTKVHIEKKHADLVFQLKAAGLGLIDPANMSEFEAVAGAKAATIMSALIPGLGQIVRGEYVKGGAMLVLWLVCMIVMFAIGIRHVLAIIGIDRTISSPNVLALVFALLALLVHFTSILDAASNIKKGPVRKPERPTPPANLPYD